MLATLRGEAGACVLGCLIVLTVTILTLFLGGLLLRRPTVHPVSVEGRELRYAPVPTEIFFAPAPGRVVGSVPAETRLWVRPIDEGWAAVYADAESKHVLGFVPEQTLRPVAATEATTRPRRRRLVPAGALRVR